MTAALQVFADRAVWRRSGHDGGGDEGVFDRFGQRFAEHAVGQMGERRRQRVAGHQR
jgi:hypothetical protein